MKNRKILWFAAAFLLLAGGPAFAQVTLDVTRQVVPKVTIGFFLPDSLPEFNAVLSRDINLSGFFAGRRLNPGQKDDSEVFLYAEAKNGAVEVRVFSAQNLLRAAYQETFSRQGVNEKYLAHRIAKAVIERLTGQPALPLSRIAAGRKKDGNQEIVLLDYDGEQLWQLTSDGSLNLCPRFSPDGSSLIYTSFLKYWPKVFQHEIATGRRWVVAEYPGLNNAAVFSPNGRQLALSLSRDGNPEIYLLTVKTQELKRLTNNPAVDTSPVFLPGGRSLIFLSDRSGQPQIHRLDLDTLTVKRLTFSGSYNTSPAVSPDGRFLAYTSNTGGQFELRIMLLETGQDVLLTGGPGNKEDPCFAPDSRHLVFVYTENHRSNLKMLDILTGEEYIITKDGGYSRPDWH